MGVWEQVYSSNRPENSKWRTKKKKRLEKGTIWGNMRKCYGCKREFLPAVYPQMTNKFLLEQSPIGARIKQSMKWRLGRKANRYYHMPPQSVTTKCDPPQENR